MACITGEVAGSKEPITTSRRLSSQAAYSKREGILWCIRFRAGVPDQVVQDRQEAKNPAAPKQHFPPRALPGSLALFRPFPGTGPGAFQYIRRSFQKRP
jgi:hypothetical protein